jgi:hypothetical protein
LVELALGHQAEEAGVGMRVSIRVLRTMLRGRRCQQAAAEQQPSEPDRCDDP